MVSPWRWTLRDGTVVRLTVSGKVNGPDQIGGLQFGTNYPYVSVNGKSWERPGCSKTTHYLRQLIEISDTEAELREWLEMPEVEGGGE